MWWPVSPLHPQLPSCRVWCHRADKPSDTESRKDIWGHLRPKFTLVPLQSLITSKIYGQSGGKKEILHRADWHPHLFFFFFNNSRDDILWQNLGMTVGQLETQWEVSYFGVWSILYMQRSDKKGPRKWAGEMVREWVSAGLIFCVNSEN